MADDTDNVARSGQITSLIPALLVAGLAFLGGAAAFYAPPPLGQMAVVFPFGTSERTAYLSILAAGGRFVASSYLPNVAVAYAADTGFAARVHAVGALLTLAAHGLCGPDPNTSQPEDIAS